MTTLEKIRAEIEEARYGLINDGLDVALKIIDKYAEQEPCDDAISRQAVLEKAINVPIAKVMTDELLEYCKVTYHKVVFVNDIDKLPSVRPQEQTGKWIPGINWKCNNCGFVDSGAHGFNYCPNCGAKMVEPQESEE